MRMKLNKIKFLWGGISGGHAHTAPKSPTIATYTQLEHTFNAWGTIPLCKHGRRRENIYIFSYTCRGKIILEATDKYYKSIKLGSTLPISYNEYENNKKNIDHESNSILISEEVKIEDLTIDKIKTIVIEGKKNKFKKKIPMSKDNDKKQARPTPIKKKVVKKKTE